MGLWASSIGKLPSRIAWINRLEASLSKTPAGCCLSTIGAAGTTAAACADMKAGTCAAGGATTARFGSAARLSGTIASAAALALKGARVVCCQLTPASGSR